MDAVDPSLVNQIEHFASEVTGVERVTRLRARWVGHELFAELTIVVGDTLLRAESDQIAEHVEAALLCAVPHLSEINIHVDPAYQYETGDEE